MSHTQLSAISRVDTFSERSPPGVFPDRSQMSFEAHTLELMAANALAELPSDVAAINRIYQEHVSRRSLVVLPEIAAWLEHSVNVFLRHDAVFVFAIQHAQEIGMTNHVELRNAAFIVNEIGRQQTLQKRGTLSNGSTVHAFVNGELVALGNDPGTPDFGGWVPVVYRPAAGNSFLSPVQSDDVTGSSMHLIPIRRAARVMMAPGKIKVWCQDPQFEHSAADEYTAHDFGELR